VLRIPVGPFVYFMAAMIGLAGPGPRVCGSSARYPGAPPRRLPENLLAEALTGLLAMMVLAFLRIPIALSMGIVGIVGYAYMRDWNWAVAFATAADQDLRDRAAITRCRSSAVHPEWGNLVTRAGMSQELFRTAYAFIGHLRGAWRWRPS